MTWADFMQDPWKVALGAVVMLILGSLGVGPLRALRKRAVSEQTVAGTSADVVAKDLRRGDSMADAWEITAKRAMADRDDANDAKWKAIDEARLKVDAIAETARIAVDAANQRAQDAEARVAKAEAAATAATTRVVDLERRVTELSNEITRWQKGKIIANPSESDLGPNVS